MIITAVPVILVVNDRITWATNVPCVLHPSLVVLKECCVYEGVVQHITILWRPGLVCILPLY